MINSFNYMDKKLLDALNNLSLSLEEISNALKSKDTNKSPVANALSSGNFTNQILLIQEGISQIKTDTSSILNNQDTLLKIQKEKDKTISKIDLQNQNILKNQKTLISLQSNNKSDALGDQNIKLLETQQTIITLQKESFDKIHIDNQKLLETQQTLISLQSNNKSDALGDQNIKLLETQQTIITLQKESFDKIHIDNQKLLETQQTLITLQKESSDKLYSQTEKLLEKKQTIPSIQKEKSEEKKQTIPSIQKEKSEEKKQTIPSIQKEKSDEKRSFFKGIIDDKKKIESGLSSILLIATGIVAIGLAFKIIGSVDWKSVLALSISLPLLAIAFSALSEIKITPIQSVGLIATLVAMSTAITLSSFILSGVRPINYLQSVSAILIAGIFTLVSYGLSKIIQGMKGSSTSDILKASIVMPILFLGISTAIALSSGVLSQVRPIGFFQALSAILIAGVFTVVSYGLGKMVNGMKGLSPSDILKASITLPLIMIAISGAIAISSGVLGQVRPIGFFQALTAIMIAGVFTVISYGAGKMIQSFKGISASDAIAASIFIPIVLIALSGAIALSSNILQGVKTIGFFQALTSIMIAGVFVALSYSVAPLMKGIRGASPKEMIMGGLTIVALVSAIVLSSFMIERMSVIPFSKILSFGILSIAIAASSVIVGGALKILSKFGLKEMISGGLSLIAISTSIMLSSIILSKGNYDKYPPASWILGLLSFGVMAVALGVIIESGIGAVAIAAGLIGVVAIATSIVAVDRILSNGSYVKYPSSSWAAGTGLGLVGFGLSAVLLGTIAVTGIGAVAIAAGLIAVVAVAKTIQSVSGILSKGNYDKFPSAKWALGIGASIVAFSSAIVVLGAINSVGGIVETLSLGTVKNPIDAGISSIIKVAGAILTVDKIMSAGSYKSYPSLSWVNGVGNIMSNMVRNLIVISPLSSILKSSISSIVDITKTIGLIDDVFSSGSFKVYPSSDWSNSSISILSKIGSAFIFISKDQKTISDGSATAVKIVKSISYIDSIFSHGNYKKYPDKVWIDGVSRTLLGVSDTMRVIDSNYSISSILIGAKKIDIISNLIENISKNISRGVYTKYPNNNWSVGVSKSIHEFMTINSGLLSGLSLLTSDNSSLIKISDTIISIDSKFSKGSFSKYPTMQWVNGTIYALQKFKSIVSMITLDDMSDKFSMFSGKNSLTLAISNIQMLAVVFDKLAKSIKSFTTSIGEIDANKLSNIRSLSSNVVLLSLMDSDQFDKMMGKIEERSGVFSELIKDFNTKKTTVSNSNTFKQGSVVTQEKSDFEILGSKVDRMTSVLVDISSVVGSRGSLKTYLSSIKNDVNIGNSSRVSRN